MNTSINYLYRDSSNYKVWNNAIVSGVLAEEQIETILSCLDEDTYFIPHLVGLPEKKFDTYDPELDHDFFELGKHSFEQTFGEPTANITADELVDLFLAHKGNWSCENSSGDKEGVCPICGSSELEYGSDESLDDGGVIPWMCCSCGAYGKEGYSKVFDRHYCVRSADGNPVPGRPE